jgi:prepilin-type N-terminal cleavage/methylation domain-containing protein
MRLTALRAGPAAARGMTLIELMIGLAIAAILLLLAAPAYRDFIANTNVRNAAENTVAGLRQARAEAVKRNTVTKFSLTADGWGIEALEFDGTKIEDVTKYSFSEGAKKSKLDSKGNRWVVCFNGLGRVDRDRSAVYGCGDDKRIEDIQFDTDMTSDIKKWHVLVGGKDGDKSGARMCTNNPTLRSGNPDDPSLCPLENPDR